MHTLISPRCSIETNLLEVSIIEIVDKAQFEERVLKLTLYRPNFLVLLRTTKSISVVAND